MANDTAHGPDVDPAKRRMDLTMAIRRGDELPAPVREALADLVNTVGFMVEMPADEDTTPRAARWTVAAKEYARLAAAGPASPGGAR